MTGAVVVALFLLVSVHATGALALHCRSDVEAVAWAARGPHMSSALPLTSRRATHTCLRAAEGDAADVLARTLSPLKSVGSSLVPTVNGGADGAEFSPSLAALVVVSGLLVGEAVSATRKLLPMVYAWFSAAPAWGPLVGSAVVSLLYLLNSDLAQGPETIYAPLPGTAAAFPLRWFIRKQAARWAAVVATLGSGCAMAFTGPAAEMGMTMGRALGLALPSEASRRRLVLACAGAGMTANFDTPLTGVFFAADISQGLITDTSSGSAASRRMDVIAILLASAAASVACRRGFVGTGHPALHALSFTLGKRPEELAAFVALGAAGGLLNVYFDRARRAAAATLARLPQAARPLVGGAVCTVAALLGHRQSVFDGFAAVKAIASGDSRYTAVPLVAFLLSKGFFVAICGASGLLGGPFAHAQFMGVALGALAKISFPAALASSHAAYAALGLAAVVAAMFRSPLVATLLVLEFTKQLDLLVPLLVVTGTASLVSQKLT